MSSIRASLAVLGGAAFGLLAATLILNWGPHMAGVAVAVCAACVIGIGLVKAIQKDRRRDRDKAIHPSMWGRMDDMPQNAMRLRIAHDRITESIIRDGEIVSERELPEVPDRWPDRFADLKPWPTGDDEAQR